MKRSDINALIRDASACFTANGWVLPPQPKWDVTDFGLGDWRAHGLVLVNLAEEPEYCEKLMYCKAGMTTPAHCHGTKKEDICVRFGAMAIQLWEGHPAHQTAETLQVRVDGVARTVKSGATIVIHAGSRVTLTPNLYHQFRPASPEAIIGEVSTANDDAHDNFFVDPRVGRFPGIVEDESPLVRLVSETAAPTGMAAVS
jgi:D-lyxose ketol-isomerase